MSISRSEKDKLSECCEYFFTSIEQESLCYHVSVIVAIFNGDR